jgi:hypothetical protein
MEEYMKLYNNPQILQQIIKDNCAKQFNHLFDSDVILKFSKDEDNNLVLNNLDGGAINMDSTVAYQLSDYYKSVGDALKRLETVTEQSPEIEYKKQKDLGIIFYSPFISFVNKEFKFQTNVKNGSPEDAGPIIDVIGGIHDEGLGWAPDGTFCGECTHATCEECRALNAYNHKIRR